MNMYAYELCLLLPNIIYVLHAAAGEVANQREMHHANMYLRRLLSRPFDSSVLSFSIFYLLILASNLDPSSNRQHSLAMAWNRDFRPLTRCRRKVIDSVLYVVSPG